jgi:hypothetical protein
VVVVSGVRVMPSVRVMSGVHVMPSVCVMPSVHVVVSVHVVPSNLVAIVVLATGLAAGVPHLSFPNDVVGLIALALVRRTVALAARIVIALAHEPGVIAVCRAVLLVLVGRICLMHVLVHG